MRLLLLASLLVVVYAAIGPIADMDIVNGNISPDGFQRAFVFSTIVFLLFMR